MDTASAGCYSPAMLALPPRLALALCVFAIALALRAAAAWWLPLGADESQSIVEFWWPALWHEQERWLNPPGWRAAMMALLRLTDDLLLLRLVPAVLAATGCAWLSAALWRGRRDAGLGAMAAGLAGVGLAMTPWAARSQGQARAYGATLLAAVALTLALRALLLQPDRRRHLLAGLAVGAGAWIHFTTLLWVGPWLLAVIVTCRRAGDDAPDRPTARRRRWQALAFQAGPALLLAGLLLWTPIYLAAGGWQLKQGASSASMVPLDADFDLLIRPEPWLALMALWGAWRGWRRWPTEVAIALAALAVGGAILTAAGQARTVRWTHLVVAGPGLWVGAAVALQSMSERSRRPLATAVALALLWGTAAHLGTLASDHRRDDDLVLARWRAEHAVVHVAAYAVATDAQAQSISRGLLHASGGYGDHVDRCVGADRVHLPRCRARVRAVAASGCRALCDRWGCIWHLRGLPKPSQPASQGDKPCTAASLAGAQPMTLALLARDRTLRQGLDPAAALKLLGLADRDASRWTMRSVGRWRILSPMDRGHGAGSMSP